jgi:hypothetical protein
MEVIIKNNSHCFHRSKVAKGNLIKILAIEYYHKVLQFESLDNPISRKFSPSLIEFKIQDLLVVGHIHFLDSLLCPSVDDSDSLVNFMYIVLQIFQQYLFPLIKRMILIDNKLITVLICSYFTCTSI